MSGTGKKVTDVAFKASKNIDWDGMAKLLVSDEARKEFANLRRAFNEVNSQLETKFNREPEPIDWEYYRKGIGPRLVDMYKEAYDSIEIPKFVDTVTPQYKPKFDALLVELADKKGKGELVEHYRVGVESTLRGEEGFLHEKKQRGVGSGKKGGQPIDPPWRIGSVVPIEFPRGRSSCTPANPLRVRRTPPLGRPRDPNLCRLVEAAQRVHPPRTPSPHARLSTSPPSPTTLPRTTG